MLNKHQVNIYVTFFARAKRPGMTDWYVRQQWSVASNSTQQFILRSSSDSNDKWQREQSTLMSCELLLNVQAFHSFKWRLKKMDLKINLFFKQDTFSIKNLITNLTVIIY